MGDDARMSQDGRVVVLSGGVGGAKLVLGLARTLPADRLLVVANTGDDFRHYGLHVSPDIDTVVYTLAGLANAELGWGRQGESWNFMAALKALGGEDWFNLGDGDLAMHVLRTHRLDAGEGLGAVTADLCRALGIAVPVLPMTDDPVATVVETADGPLAFQHYFVRDRCRPAVTGFRFDGIEAARPHPDLLAALGGDAAAVVIAPSNPFVSVDPILRLPGLRHALDAFAGPIVAVSPIVGGVAIKGPAAKMMAELGMPASALAVARHYQGLVDGLVIDHADAAEAAEIRALGMAVLVTATVMRDLEDRKALARDCLAFATDLAGAGA
jgi:LPPG:FO 2-phospho-L-lactate transferase